MTAPANNSITIEGVPETITRAEYQTLIKFTGLDLKDLVNLRFSPDGIYADVHVRDADGRLIPNHMALGFPPQMHSVFIRVVDEDETDDPAP